MPSLLHHPTDIPMRPFTDKELEVIDLDRLFEEYVETELFQPYSDSTADQSSSDDLAHLFDLTSSNESDAFATSPILDQDMDMAWHKAVDPTEQNHASSMPIDSSSFYTDERVEESHSNSDLLNFEDIFELEHNQLRSVSQPSTPRPHTTRSVKKAVSFNDRSIPRGVQKTPRKFPSTSFTKMRQPSFYRAPIPDVWKRKVEAPANSYTLRASSNGVISPPTSTKFEHHEQNNGLFHRAHQSYTGDHSPLTSPTIETGFSNYQLTPQASPAIGIDNTDHFSANMRLAFSSSPSSAALSALQTPPSSLRLPMTTWGPDASPSLDFGFSASPDYSGTKTAGWWDDEQPHSNSRHSSQNVAAMEDLGISCDTTSFDDFAGLGIHGLPNTDNNVLASSFDMSNYTTSATNIYPTPPNHHHQSHIVPIGHRPLSRTPSPTPQPRFHRRRPSSQNLSAPQAQRTSRSARRKSSGTSSRQSSSGNVGFVNFTPHDSRKILTGVAPSGSSKTKARREKEAADKRTKLSQAAVRAIVEAGGDLGMLEREGLLVLES